MRRTTLFLTAILVGVSAYAGYKWTESFNGFEVDKATALIPPDEIHSGGPPRDGIPSIDEPRFLSTGDKGAPEGKARVLGLVHNGVAKAYPVSIMNWHEIVNDRFDGSAVVVTYCPLCGSGVAYDAHINGKDVTFGVSGLLYNSDVLLYDRQSESLWSQIMSRAVAGPMTGKRLKMLPLIQTTWEEWHNRYPDSLVLSRDTGYSRDYGQDPYAGYEDSHGVWFPVKHKDRRYHPKERVLGVEVDGQFKAYPFAELSQTSGRLADEVAGKQLVVHFDDASNSARVTDTQGNEFPAIMSFWFAWYAFHPDTGVFTVD
ncbi:MAG: DUF3179 domain-containing protein [Sedimenticola sp.]